MYRIQLYVPGFNPDEPLGTSYDTFEEAEEAMATLRMALASTGADTTQFDYEIVS